jgi:tetratricopeptide (TPR) repeat protein
LTRPVLALLFAAALAARAAEQGQLDSNPTLFTVMAALDAAASDANAPTDPLRASVRAAVWAKKPPVMPEIRSFLYKHRKADAGLNLAPFVSFALSHGEPPRFVPTLFGSEAPPDVQEMGEFHNLLVRFYQEAGIEDIWRKVQPAYEAQIARYHEPVSRTLLEVNAYLRNPTSGYMGRRFQIYLELLAPPNQVHTRSYKDDYFIVVTPSAQPRIDDVRHAYLHYLLDPIATKFNERLSRVRGLGDFAQAAPALEMTYKEDFLLLATESLIKAVEARLNRRPADAQQALSEGFVLTPYFHDALAGYEKQEAAMRLFFPDMVDAIDLKKEDRRLQQVQWAESKAVRTAPPAAVAPQPGISAAERSLEDADKLYGARELDKAREAYLALTRQTDEKSVHARAYYGLGRIAALKNEPDLAEQLFRKTLELTPDAHTRAWAEVYLGRLAEGFGEPERAGGHYKAALGVEGAPPGARQAAEQGLSKIKPR